MDDPFRGAAVRDMPGPVREGLVRRAYRLEWLTVCWMVFEAVIAIGSGIAAHSLSLIAFGADSVIELVSAGVLLWRLLVEIRNGEELSEAVERRATRIAGTLLFALAAYVVASAGYSLARHQGQEFSAIGLTISVLAVPIMYFFAKSKLRIAEQIARRADLLDHSLRQIEVAHAHPRALRRQRPGVCGADALRRAGDDRLCNRIAAVKPLFFFR